MVVGHHVSCLCAMQLRHLTPRIAAVFYAGRKQVREEWVLHRRPAVTGRPQPAVRPPLGLVNTDALPAYARLRTGASHQCGPALQCRSEHQRSPPSRALTSSFTGFSSRGSSSQPCRAGGCPMAAACEARPADCGNCRENAAATTCTYHTRPKSLGRNERLPWGCTRHSQRENWWSLFRG